jgi:hypothetical protein
MGSGFPGELNKDGFRVVSPQLSEHGAAVTSCNSKSREGSKQKQKAPFAFTQAAE